MVCFLPGMGTLHVLFFFVMSVFDVASKFLLSSLPKKAGNDSLLFAILVMSKNNFATKYIYDVCQ